MVEELKSQKIMFLPFTLRDKWQTWDSVSVIQTIDLLRQYMQGREHFC